ncbi:hypothetical protein [Acidicapsa acidisoli]|uniref:hypothetical protein n=1 Tax=Acidicapsa acidisoli TaxID=1615681 RepID=UPI0021E0467D|nr:hypothetical protein [Acidicapsa acidisoli]
MSGYLSNLLSRTFQHQAALQPHTVSIFGPASAEPGWTPTSMTELESHARETPLQLGQENSRTDSIRAEPPPSSENVQMAAADTLPVKLASQVMPPVARREVSVPSKPVGEALSAPHVSERTPLDGQDLPVSAEGVATRNDSWVREREAPAAGQKRIPPHVSSEAKAELAEKTILHRVPSPLKDEVPVVNVATRLERVVETMSGRVKEASQLDQPARHEEERQIISGNNVPSPRGISGKEVGRSAMTATPASPPPHEDTPQVPVVNRPSSEEGENYLRRDIEAVTLVPIPSLRQLEPRETRAGFHEQRQPAREPVIEVTIGRIEVRAAAVAEHRQPGPTSSAVPSLEEYLRRRSGKSRHE